MSTGADNKTLPVTKEYEEGYERIFGKKEPERGTWIQDPVSGKLIPADQYQAAPPDAAVNHVVIDRHYWGQVTTDGTDIGSKKRHQEYMRQNGLTTADDYRESWKKKAEQRERVRRGERGSLPSKTRREAIARKLYEIDKP